MGKCLHYKFIAQVDVNRLMSDDDPKEKQPIGYTADISIKCAECGVNMEFIGLPGGVNFSHPTTSVDRIQLRAPLIPGIKTIVN